MFAMIGNIQSEKSEQNKVKRYKFSTYIIIGGKILHSKQTFFELRNY